MMDAAVVSRLRGGLSSVFVVLWVGARLSAFAAAGGGGEEVNRREHTQPKSEQTLTYHWLRTWYVMSSGGKEEGPPKVDRVEEGWVAPQLGHRVEVRRETRLTSVIVQTPRWSFVWDVAGNVVAAYPPHSVGLLMSPRVPTIEHRDSVVRRAERDKATYVSQKEKRGDTEVEKIVFRYLADPAVDGDWPIHRFVPEAHQKLLQSPNAKFRTRTYWFDPKTKLLVGYQCGCRSAKNECWIDYPAPASVPRELFTLRVPREATLEINDPELGRQVRSEGQKGPDLRE